MQCSTKFSELKNYNVVLERNLQTIDILNYHPSFLDENFWYQNNNLIDSFSYK